MRSLLGLGVALAVVVVALSTGDPVLQTAGLLLAAAATVAAILLLGTVFLGKRSKG